MAEINWILVIGAGTMGHGIAQTAAAAGYRVLLNDVSEDLIRTGIASIGKNLEKGIQKGKVSAEERDATLGRIEVAANLEAAARVADLVIEAAPEKLELKESIFKRLDGSAPPEAILASNTSSLPIGKIAAATGRPDRVIGMHFFNPVHIMPLLELVRGDGTSDETLEAALEVARRMGKDPIVVRDMPGFATSRLGVVLGLEAMRMLEQGVASASDIDKAMTLGYRHPMGPLRLTDLVGLDVRLHIAEHLYAELKSDAFNPPKILRQMVADGSLGKKTGRGFYDW
ncbi:MAG: 3-hydroxyacyl-CoA dehydrogenase family protein [Acidobacteria bacterium]|uniref:3-hydroxyacyl-CoA dehydrogenase family protein n=1 Tax=Candidatus Polarisedimenticola svalbardensis TaxID=2886004 RepID=A0A8J7CFG1_9BACT|nr:3-hydroxyacyl-CoA dehydrogenase family protein [Candidatus Polarisedimenticola svalbardensis]